MFEIVRLLKSIHAERRGVTAVEYGIMAALISAVLVTAVGFFSSGLGKTFSRVGSQLT